MPGKVRFGRTIAVLKVIQRTRYVIDEVRLALQKFNSGIVARHE